MIVDAPAMTVLQHIRDLVDGEATKKLTDAQLLERFAVNREESAFAALLHRHGRLVWGVCRNILRIEQDAEDAFQATFLVLARQPVAIHKKHSVGSWLYGVAYRVAMKAKKKMNKRQARERGAVEQAAGPPGAGPGLARIAGHFGGGNSTPSRNLPCSVCAVLSGRKHQGSGKP
jgi:hypothetical protein